jgi:hypothetical protein
MLKQNRERQNGRNKRYYSLLLINNEIFVFSWVISSAHLELKPTLFYFKTKKPPAKGLMIIQKRNNPQNNNVLFNLDHLKEAIADCTQK